MNKRGTHSPEFKSSVARGAVSDRQTIQEITADYATHPSQVSLRNRQLLDRASELFTRGNKSKHKAEDHAKEVELSQQIGDISMELIGSKNISSEGGEFFIGEIWSFPLLITAGRSMDLSYLSSHGDFRTPGTL